MKINPKVEKARKEVRREIISLLKQGDLTYQDVASITNSSYSHIYMVARQEGLQKYAQGAAKLKKILNNIPSKARAILTKQAKRQRAEWEAGIIPSSSPFDVEDINLKKKHGENVAGYWLSTIGYELWPDDCVKVWEKMFKAYVKKQREELGLLDSDPQDSLPLGIDEVF